MSSSSSYWRITETDAERRVEFPVVDALTFSERQWEYFRGDWERELMCAGRGVGKDHLALLKKVVRAFREYLRRRAMGSTWNRGGARYFLAILAGDEKSYQDCLAKLHDFIPVIPGGSEFGGPNYHYSSERLEWTLFGRGELVIKAINLYRAQQAKGENDHARFRGPGFDDALVTEGQKLGLRMLSSDIFPMVFRPGYPGWITINGTPNDGWFDEACDQAEERRGYFGNWSLWTATSFDNPLLTPEAAEQIAREREANPWLFDRERMARRHVRMPAEVAPDSPFRLGLLECGFTDSQAPLQPGQALVSWDLFYGGDDEMVRCVFDKVTCQLVAVDVWNRSSFQFDVKSPDYSGFIGLFEKTARDFPGCKQVYDATGPYGVGLAPHLPRHLRIMPIVRNNAVKNKHVGDLLARLEQRGADGKSMGIRLPDPNKCAFASDEQRRQMRRLVDQLTHYRAITATKAGTPTLRYTKGEGYGDDLVDAVTLGCSELPVIGRKAGRLAVAGLGRAMLG